MGYNTQRELSHFSFLNIKGQSHEIRTITYIAMEAFKLKSLIDINRSYICVFAMGANKFCNLDVFLTKKTKYT
jgi:hypothetical protein